jgi:O-antigen biosynthesis protein
MKDIAKKAFSVYKNHGVKGVARKARTTLRYRTRTAKRVLSFRRESLEKRGLREEYQFVSNEVFQITTADIAASKDVCHTRGPLKIETATWFVPYFNHFAFGGIQTIFRFIEKLSMEGVYNRIVIYDNPTVDKEDISRQINNYFPRLTNYELVVFSDNKIEDIENLPPSDIAFCTMWVSAYFLLRYNKTKRKYYFIQDYEPFFYVAGSTFALAESTYRFGFRGLVNTPGLLAAINQRHGLEGISFIPSVNKEVYYQTKKQRNDRVRIFFYARPSNPRNAFNLGVLTIKHLLEKYGDKIEIITAGAEWKEEEYELEGKITNLGLIKTIEEVAALYRSCDIGFAFMLNKHPSYQMLEYTASGMATVMNFNEDHTWLYKDGKNCLISEPSPTAMSEQIGRLIEDPVLREKLTQEAQKLLISGWSDQLDIIWNDIRQH